MQSTSQSMTQQTQSSLPSPKREQELWDKWATNMVSPPHWTDWQKPHWTDRFRSDAQPEWLVSAIVYMAWLTMFFSTLIGALAGLG